VEGVIIEKKTVALFHNFINRHNAFQLIESSSGAGKINQHPHRYKYISRSGGIEDGSREG
jgi:hypothetical protein